MSSESEFAGGDAVRIGGYSLEIATAAGSFARFEPEQESTNARALAAALEEKPEERPLRAIEKFEASAQEVTGRIEEAEGLLREAADGRLLDAASLPGKVDSLLGLLERLDKSDRFEEELALMRSLNGLLALLFRWLELVRSLRSLLASAEASGHEAGQAWAHHELGSLHLCAGNAEEAAKHLDEALRIQEQLGDLSGLCATRHNLDAVRRQLAGPVRPPRRLVLLALLAALLVGLGAGGTSLAYALHDGGGGDDGGGGTSVAFTVSKDFEPANPAAVSISVTCTKGGRPDKSPKPAREGTAAVFTISDLAAGATCTATEGAAPAGYTASEGGCRDVAIASGKPTGCTITNTRERPASVTFAVTKDFEPDDPEASVSISVNCTGGGTPDAGVKTTREGTPAVFTISGAGDGATCTATEGEAPSGYTGTERDCLDVVIAERPSCTITNRLNSTTFSVGRTFEDGSRSTIAVEFTCDSGTVEPSQGTAGEDSPAVFTVTGFTAGTTCTATTVKSPSGYNLDESACEAVRLDARECTIVFGIVE